MTLPIPATPAPFRTHRVTVLPFACRDNATMQLRDQSKPRISYCRKCKARKEFHKCLFNYDKAQKLLRRNGHTRRADTPKTEPSCSRCHGRPAAPGMKYCAECMDLRWHKCANPNCEALTTTTYCRSCAGIRAHAGQRVG